MKITSTAFKEGQTIPDQYTCHGENIAPDIKIEDVPENTKIFALVMDDPDAPKGTFDHWVLWDIPGSVRQITPHRNQDAWGHGVNSYGVTGYKGPCPPPGGVHHYHFKVYALDEELSLPNRSAKADVEQAMEGHILAKAELIGLFQHKPKV